MTVPPSDHKRSEDPASDEKVGYGKPPVRYRFKPRNANAPPVRRGPKPDRSVDVAAILSRPMKVSGKGRTKKIDARQLALESQARRALEGSFPAMKAFFKACRIAGLLERPAQAPTCGVFVVPRDIPYELGVTMFTELGQPPWSDDVRQRYLAHYLRGRTRLQAIHDTINGFDHE
ncbi:MAG: hypothetical protein AB7G25_02985 [Sphingomonadaceae bacterium]